MRVYIEIARNRRVWPTTTGEKKIMAIPVKFQVKKRKTDPRNSD